MQTQTVERRELCEIINTLSDAVIEKLSNYIDFLRYEERMEELEEAEDIAYIDSLTPEDYANAVPLSEIINDYEAEYGPLDLGAQTG